MIDNDPGQCELMKILSKRREAEARQGLSEDRVIVQDTGGTMARGGQLYRIIQKFETGDLKPSDDESDEVQAPDVPIQTGHVPTVRSFLFSVHSQNNRDSGSSVNSHLSRLSPGKKTDSFSSNSGDSVTSEGSCSYSKNTARRTRHLRASRPESKQPFLRDSSGSNKSFLWRNPENPNGLTFVDGKTTTDDHSDASSIAGEAEYCSLNDSDDNNNQSDALSQSMQNMNIYETLPNTDFNDGGSAEENIYESINFSGASSVVPDSDKLDSSTIASDEYGSEHYEDIDNYPQVLVSAVNKQFSGVDLAPITPDRTETKAEKYQRKLRDRVSELVHTEAMYVSKLRHVVKDYIPLLRGDGGPPSLAGLPPEAVFSNIEQLYKFHSREFLPALRDSQQNLLAIGKIFRIYEKKFTMYIKYSRNNKRCTRLVYDNKLFFKQKQNEVGKRLDLSSYLLEPIQRLPRYLLFINELVQTRAQYDEEIKAGCRDSVISSNDSVTYENIPNDYGDGETPLQSLQAARVMIKALLRKVDNAIAIENVVDCPFELLKEGELLRQDEFQVTDSNKKRYQMRCFLFEAGIIFTIVSKKQLKEEIFTYYDKIGMGDLGITPPENDTATSFTVWYRKRTSSPYIMEAEQKVRMAWVNDISDLLWQQAVRDKEKVQSKRYSNVSMALSEASTSKDCGPGPFEDPAAPLEAAPPSAGDQCTSAKRKKRKQKVKSNVSDTLVFVGRNMNVFWSSLK